MFVQGGDEMIPRMSPTIGSTKEIITVGFTDARLLRFLHLLQGQKCNKDNFINEILTQINKEYNHGAGHGVTKKMKIHMDNSRVHNTLETAEKI
jgi:hypothetical protein